MIILDTERRESDAGLLVAITVCPAYFERKISQMNENFDTTLCTHAKTLNRWLNGGAILIAESDVTARVSLAELFKMCGCRVAQAADSKELLNASVGGVSEFC